MNALGPTAEQVVDVWGEAVTVDARCRVVRAAATATELRELASTRPRPAIMDAIAEQASLLAQLDRACTGAGGGAVARALLDGGPTALYYAREARLRRAVERCPGIRQRAEILAGRRTA